MGRLTTTQPVCAAQEINHPAKQPPSQQQRNTGLQVTVQERCTVAVAVDVAVGSATKGGVEQHFNLGINTHLKLNKQ